MVTAGVMEGIHTLIITAVRGVGKRAEEAGNDCDGGLACTGGVEGEESPHDAIVFVFVVTYDPGPSFFGIVLEGAQCHVPVGVGDRIVEDGHIFLEIHF